jgi:hypothetical protein
MGVRIDWIGGLARIFEMSVDAPKEKVGNAEYNDKLTEQEREQDDLRKFQVYFLRINFSYSF